jgi:hypothetical protein
MVLESDDVTFNTSSFSSSNEQSYSINSSIKTSDIIFIAVKEKYSGVERILGLSDRNRQTAAIQLSPILSASFSSIVEEIPDCRSSTS